MIQNNSPKNIFLIGLMGSGKTRVGRIISNNLKLKFCDMDEEIEKNYGMTIAEIFQSHGEAYFRDIETETLKKIAEKAGQVISTGGGVVMKNENWVVLNKNGITIYLRASVDVLWSRIEQDSNNEKLRPLLQVEDPLGKMKELLSERTTLYEKALIIIDTDKLDPNNIAERVIKEISLIH
ncbi:shikimate kinase [Desulfobacterota bacterium AH_259_B03_O07]|nr:shikimate kinase [Desulfobacterota bacterium AH_259_B03_O07]